MLDYSLSRQIQRKVFRHHMLFSTSVTSTAMSPNTNYQHEKETNIKEYNAIFLPVFLFLFSSLGKIDFSSSLLTCSSESSNMFIRSLAAASTSELFKCKVWEPFIQSSCYQTKTICTYCHNCHVNFTVTAAFINTNVKA